jgi:glycosyltransferase involved in cell wall biosynthesis
MSFEMQNDRCISILHLITSLDVGGTEKMLLRLLSSIDKDKFYNQVICLTDNGLVGQEIKKQGIPVYALNLPKGSLSLVGLIKLWHLLRSIRPKVLQTWLYHADLIGIVFGRLAGIRNICWNIRCSYMDLSKYKFTTRWVLNFCSFLSNLPSCIISNSSNAVTYHKSIGYKGKRWQVIPNGFDLNLYKPDGTSKSYLIKEIHKNGQLTDEQFKRLRKHLEDDQGIAIGYIARFDPMKDHFNFISAAKIVLSKLKNVHFILIGKNITWHNDFFTNHIPLDLRKNFHLLGERHDIWQITPAFDIASSASYGEGFPNVICEAMACGIPCVVTNVGDCTEIVGETGVVVEPRNSQALAKGWLSLIQVSKDEREQLGNAARKRVIKHFELNDVTKEYENLYISLVRNSLST